MGSSRLGVPGDRVFLVCVELETSARAGANRFPPADPMPFLADLLVALGVALVTFMAARWYAASPNAPDQPTEEVARAVGEAAGSHPASRTFVARRLDRTAVTGSAPDDGTRSDVPRRSPARCARAPRPPGRVDPARRQLGGRVGLRPPERSLHARAALGHRFRQHPDRRRACSRCSSSSTSSATETAGRSFSSWWCLSAWRSRCSASRGSSGDFGRRSLRRLRRWGRRSRAATRRPRRRSMRQRLSSSAVV